MPTGATATVPASDSCGRVYKLLTGEPRKLAVGALVQLEGIAFENKRTSRSGEKVLSKSTHESILASMGA